MAAQFDTLVEYKYVSTFKCLCDMFENKQLINDALQTGKYNIFKLRNWLGYEF